MLKMHVNIYSYESIYKKLYVLILCILKYFNIMKTLNSNIHYNTVSIVRLKRNNIDY